MLNDMDTLLKQFSMAGNHVAILMPPYPIFQCYSYNMKTAIIFILSFQPQTLVPTRNHLKNVLFQMKTALCPKNANQFDSN